MSNWKKKIKIRTILLAAALLAAAATGATYAWQTWNLEMTNELTAHETKVSIVENFNPETGDKIVRFKNEGTSSVFLRVSYTEFWEIESKAWTDESDSGVAGGTVEQGYFPSTILPNTVYDWGTDGLVSKKIAKKYCGDNKEWTAGRTDGQEWIEDNLASIGDSEGDKKKKEWTDGGDGWFYYNKVLKAGNGTSCKCDVTRIDTETGNKNNIIDNCECSCCTGEILTKVLFDQNLLEAHEEYKDAHYQLYFKAEVVQCSDGSNTLNSYYVNKDATKKLFGKIAEVGDDGIVTWKQEGGE